MKSDENQNIDELKEGYKYTIDPLNLSDNAYIIFGLFYGRFVVRFNEYYRLEEKIKEIKHIMLKKGDKIPKNILDSYEAILKDISDGCQQAYKKVDSYFDEYDPIIWQIFCDYEKNRDKPGAVDIYLKIGKEIIDKEVNTLIHYEKILISLNDKIITLKKNLSN